MELKKPGFADNYSDTKSVVWRSPSNIALVKYWGKYGNQYPQNPSLSFTLSQSYSQTSVLCAPRSNTKTAKSEPDFEFTFHGQPNEKFAMKIGQFLQSLTAEFPFLAYTSLQIDSVNSFPHSSGIASSASGMSALVLCLCSLQKQFNPNSNYTDNEWFFQNASRIARLGSGSACRSVYAQAAVWGTCSFLPDSSREYAIPYQNYLHPNFENYCDTILIVNRSEKSVSSRAGHGLMNGNPFADIRYSEAKNNMEKLHRILQSGDLETFTQLVELEALGLHALMMTSSPSFILMRPNTLAVIEKIRQFRKDTQHPVCFTLDAGPNVHVLYPQAVKEPVAAFIAEQLLPLCEDNYCIWDSAGNGPEQLT